VEGVLRAMWIKKLKTAAMILLASCVLAGGIGQWSRPRALAQREPDKKPELPNKPGVPDKAPDRIKDLLKSRFEAAKDENEARMKEFLAGRGTLDCLIDSSLRLLTAELEMNQKYEAQLAALESYAKRMKELYEVNEARYKAGQVSVSDFKQSTYFHLDAKLRLERAKSKAVSAPPRD
jgi:hypothetical protein